MPGGNKLTEWSDPSESQKTTVRYRDGPLLIIADPGSGKTVVLACRVAYLIRAGNFVIVGDAGKDFTYEHPNKALTLVLDGADMLALEKDRYWLSSEGLALSTGPFVAALEYATGKEAELMGKPSPEFFNLALKDMGVGPRETAMIGDDILTDVLGAQNMGMKGILVETGKYREDQAKESGVTPDLVLRSIAELVEYL